VLLVGIAPGDSATQFDGWPPGVRAQALLNIKIVRHNVVHQGVHEYEHVMLGGQPCTDS
jgi:hypothetical protein